MNCKLKQNKKKMLFVFYNHPFIAIFVYACITIAYFFSFFIDKVRFNTVLNVIYLLISLYILCSIELKAINYVSDVLYRCSSKIWNTYKINSWENLSDIERFYKIGWRDDYLHDLLILLKDRHVLPSYQQINFYMDSSGSINSVALYELLVSRLQTLTINELIMLRHYIEIKSVRHVYQRNATLDNVKRIILMISNFAFSLTILQTKEEVKIDNITIKNLSAKAIKHTIIQAIQAPTLIIIVFIVVIILIITICISLGYYNAKHLRYTDVIHQALLDAYSIRINRDNSNGLPRK